MLIFGSFLGGVTRTLNISYLKAIPIGTSALPSFLSAMCEVRGSFSFPVGTTVRLHSEVTQIGKTMAMIRGVMASQDGKTTYCTCEHHKVSVPTQPNHLNYKVSWDDLWAVEAAEKNKTKL